MKFMHTKLPEFIEKMKSAVKKGPHEKEITITGLENLRCAKMQSLRTGRIEEAVEELARRDDIESVEVAVVPRIPETMHTVAVIGRDAEGRPQKAILEVINILHPTEEVLFGDCPDVEDRRPPIGKH